MWAKGTLRWMTDATGITDGCEARHRCQWRSAEHERHLDAYRGRVAFAVRHLEHPRVRVRMRRWRKMPQPQSGLEECLR